MPRETEALRSLRAANMPRGNHVYTGSDAVGMETLRKPEKMSTKELRTAIEQQETEMSKIEVHRARMQTHHWNLVHELSKCEDDVETSDVEIVVEKGWGWKTAA